MNEKHYLDTLGLTTLWSKIKSLFATKTELSNGLNSKANDSEVVHKSGNETIADTKTFSSNIVGSITGNSATTTKFANAISISIADNDGSNIGPSSSMDGSTNVIVNLPSTIKANITGTADSATKATQDSDGKQINTTYLPLAGGLMDGNIYRSTNDGYIIISGGVERDSGGNIILSGKNYDTGAGKVTLQARSDAGVNIVEITPDVGVVPISYNAQGISLGTSSNKWKTINGINPGALSLPNHSPSVFISKSLPNSGGTITADVDCWFEIRAKATSPNAFIQLFVAGGSSSYAKNTGDTLIISVPMRAGIYVTIFYKDIETSPVCRLVPCIGNV